MTPAIDLRLLEQVDPRAARALALPERAQAALFTLDGKFITAGVAEIVSAADHWRARMRHLDRPGLIATMYFAEGIREVMLRLDDGRCATAHIAGTTFTAGGQRVCDLRGCAPLS